MNKTFQTVTSVLIIILLFLLVWVFVSYYIEPVPDPAIPVVNDNSNVQPPIDKEYIDITIPSEPDIDIQQENNSSDEEEIIPNTTVTDIIKENTTDNQEGSSVIISSDPNISNAEKQQILTELDEALSELLIVVDSVTIVDETRLGIDEEVEVQE